MLESFIPEPAEERTLYVTEGPDSGRIADPEIAEKMADIENMYRDKAKERKLAWLIGPDKKLIQQGEKSAESIGESWAQEPVRRYKEREQDFYHFFPESEFTVEALEKLRTRYKEELDKLNMSSSEFVHPFRSIASQMYERFYTDENGNNKLSKRSERHFEIVLGGKTFTVEDGDSRGTRRSPFVESTNWREFTNCRADGMEVTNERGDFLVFLPVLIHFADEVGVLPLTETAHMKKAGADKDVDEISMQDVIEFFT